MEEEHGYRERGTRALMLGGALLWAGCHGLAQAQVTTDGTVGVGMALPLTGASEYRIESSLGTTRGANLFHSFSRFDVGTGRVAVFNGSNSLTSIISRVTGGGQSRIDGTIRSTAANADLYLINPFGIVFGPDASLDVQRSFLASTAGSVKLGTDGSFDALDPAASTLSTGAPSAFGFVSAGRELRLEGTALSVPAGEAITLVGGDLTLTDTTLEVPQGRVNLIATAGAGEVGIASLDPAIPAQMARGTLRVAASSLRFVGNVDTSGDPGGRILIRAGDLFLEGGRIRSENAGPSVGDDVDIELSRSLTATGTASIETKSTDMGAAGDVLIRAAEVQIGGSTLIGTDAQYFGPAGDIEIVAPSVVVRDDARISADSFGPGEGGNVSIRSDDFLFTDFTFISARTAFPDSGPAGTITITGQAMRASGEATLDTSSFFRSPGDGGSIVLDLRSLEMTEDAWIISNTFTGGRGGTIDITAEQIDLLGSNAISTTTFSSGDGGDITVIAERLTMAGAAVISSGSEGTGRAGTVTLRIGNFDASGDAVVSSESEGTNFFVRGLGVSQPTTGGGAGGDVRFETETFTLRDAAQVATGTRGTGAGGNLRVSAREVVLMPGASVSARSEGAGVAGSVAVTARDTVSLRDAAITTEATVSDGGRLEIEAGKAITIEDARVATSVNAGSGAGGDVRLATEAFAARGTAEITTGTAGAGPGGDLAISANEVLIESGAVVSARSDGTGVAGNVDVLARDALRLLDAAITTEAAVSDGGRLEIDATRAIVVRNGRIATSVSAGSGAGGDVRLTTEDFTARENAEITTGTAGAGPGGDLTISANAVLIESGTVVSARSDGTGVAGNVDVLARDALELFDAAITTEAAVSDGGRVDIDAARAIVVRNGRIATSVSAGSGAGGDVRLTTEAFTARENAEITTGTAGAGPGGDLAISANAVSIESGAVVSARSDGTGVAGNIDVLARDALELFDAAITTEAAVSDGGRVDIDAARAIVVRNGRIATSVSAGSGAGGDVRLTTEAFTARENAEITTGTAGAGPGGDLAISANAVSIESGAVVSARSDGTGVAGNIDVLARGAVSLIDAAITTEARVSDGGRVEIEAGDIIVVRNARIATSVSAGSGAGGDVRLTARGFTAQAGAEITTGTAGAGPGGDLGIFADDVLIESGALVSARSDGTGNAGNVGVVARDAVRLFDAAITTEAETSDGGDVDIEARESVVVRDARIATSVRAGNGAGGDVSIDTGSFTAQGRSEIATGTGGAGPGGSLHISAIDVRIESGALVSTSSDGTGVAGDLRVQAASELELLNAAITTEARTSDGGNVVVIAGDRILVRNSRVTTSVSDGDGNGGNILIDPPFVILNHATIVANANGGDGGNIRLVAGALFADAETVIDASSQLGIDGTVVIESPSDDVSGALASLPTAFLAADRLQVVRCAERTRSDISTIVMRPRDGLPPANDDLLAAAIPAPWRLRQAAGEGVARAPLASARAATLLASVEGCGVPIASGSF